ncbi:hypothetical protein Golob_008206, partial [Gossypium lobatum]|nr:hypothetical protein [Gossypium lobatum]
MGKDSTTRPPVSESGNYAYWKARMKFYIKATNEKA